MKPPDNKGIFASPHAHIANSFNVYQQRPPPADHPNAITCGQCDGLTWRMTDRCIHCNFDIAADAQEQQRLERLEQLRLELQQFKGKLMPLLGAMLLCTISLALAAFLAPKSPFIYWAVLAVMLVLASIIKPLAEKLESTRNQIRSLQS